MPDSTPRFQQAAELDSQVEDALLRWMLSLADTKHKLGLRLSEWVNGAPALEAAVGASAITQDELGHARSLFVVLSQFPGAPPELGSEYDLAERTAYYYPRRLEIPWDSWSDVIAANVLIDRALSVAIAATGESEFAPLQQRTAKILQEERFHRIFGDSWLARIASSDADRQGRMQAALDRSWEIALAWLGPDDDPVSAPLHQAGIVGETPAAMRAAWLSETTPLLTSHGFGIPSSAPDWAKWNHERRDIHE